MSYYTHGCGKRVSNGANHCGGCHETFRGLGAFDRHRKGLQCGIEPVKSDPYSKDSGFWKDEKGYWHFGRKMTKEEINERFR